MLVVISALAMKVIRGDPEELGLEPFGYPENNTGSIPEDEPTPVSSPKDLGLKDAAKTSSFWFIVAFMFICGSGDFMVSTHLIPFVTDHDISSTTAGNMLAWLGMMSLPGILIAGPASDKFGSKPPIAMTFVLRFFLFLLILKYRNLYSFYFFSLSFGFTFFVTAPLNPILVGRIYGLSHVGLISGVITTVHHLGGGLWAFAAGSIFDRTGSYHLTFILSAFMALSAAGLTLMLKEKDHL